MKARIFLKISCGLALMVGLALLATDYLTSRVVEKIYLDDRWEELGHKARMLAQSDPAALSEQARIRSLAGAAGARITVIARDGNVIADSHSDAAKMENHAGYPEIQDALAGHESAIVRVSPTLNEKYLYFAAPISQGVVRLSVPFSAVETEVGMIRKRVLESTALGYIPVILVALFMAQKISHRLGTIIGYAGELANGNFHSRLQDYRSGELALLARKLNETSAKLERTVQQLQTEHTELEKLERIRKDFVINVSHELRTPLASIQGYTETLIDGALYDEANNLRFLNIIRHNAERLARLTGDLLSLSRIEMKTQTFQFASYRVNELLRDVLDTIRPIADKKEIALMQELAPAGTEVFCDSEALYQILSNLVDNAVKYTPVGGKITVGINMLLVKPQASMLEIFVRDSGIGIPAEDLPRLFERFYRVDKARSRELGGTGLGLAIVKHLVRTHGGEVRVESEVNKGSTFFFTLPIEETAEIKQVTASSIVHDAVTHS
jgi:two-component system phosphate regulon sensor histidine kinase PhoR